MRKFQLVLLMLCVLPLAACGPKLKTRDITFWRADNLNDQQPAAVDIIYPRDQRQHDEIMDIGPDKWFTSELYDKVHKDKEWLDDKITSVQLENRDDEDESIIIFVQYSNPDDSPPRGQEKAWELIWDKKPKPKKHEYFFVHDGSMQRLKNKAEARKVERRSERDSRDRRSNSDSSKKDAKKDDKKEDKDDKE
jgi:hypothetical protein